ncbi:metallophosphoesterase family protein [Mesorhizobium sp. WSM4303]|nr:metallophosphoesterase family protein [Mesorhizobium sp. WSM4306]TRD01840.1 metallophosphoesterase family protein [Mesorhizobium sp. WSM4303]
MRLAVLSDIHGNLRALEAVHADIKDSSPDIIVNLGDCLSGPLWPEETAQYLIAENWPTVRGNHDRVLVEPPASGLEDVDAFAHQRLSRTSLIWLSACRSPCRSPRKSSCATAAPATTRYSCSRKTAATTSTRPLKSRSGTSSAASTPGSPCAVTPIRRASCGFPTGKRSSIPAASGSRRFPDSP